MQLKLSQLGELLNHGNNDSLQNKKIKENNK